MVTTRGVLGLVELSDTRGTGGYNSGRAGVLHDVFQDRLKSWVRDKDQWRLLNNNRICVILKRLIPPRTTRGDRRCGVRWKSPG